MKTKITISLILLFFFVLLLRINFTLAEEAIETNPSVSKEEINNQIGDKQEELKNIESKIQNYESLIELKQKQQATLSSQLEIMENQIKSMEGKITETEQEMILVDLEIKALELQMAEKDIDIKYNKNVLSELLKNIYYESQNSTIELLLKYKNLGEYFQGVERISQVNDKTKEALDNVNRAKMELQTKQEERRTKYDKIKKLNEDIVRNKYYLESEQGAKEGLLDITQGEEAKFQEMLNNVQQQREVLLGDIGQLSDEKSGEMVQIRSKQEKPKTGLASTGWFYSQRDSRWANDNIGMSRTKMGNYGCAVTCVAMVLRYHGTSITPGTLARQRIFYYDLIVWPSNWQGVERVSSNGHGNIDWGTVDKEIKAGNPVIIFIRANGRGAGHYVVVHNKDSKGRYIVHDPYWGANLFLDSTRENISTLYGSSTSIDQMIIYHGTGGTFKNVKGGSSDPKEQCEDSGGRWSKTKEKCRCEKTGYVEKGGECVKEGEAIN